jgi:hypothetical protein
VGVCDVTSRVHRVHATPHLLLRHPCHTAPFLRPFIPNSLTVHPHSFSLKAVLAASSFCPATSCSDYSPAITSSAPFLGLFVPNNSMVQRCITFTLHFQSLLIHSGEAGVSTLPVTPPLLVVSFSVLERGQPLHSVQSLSCRMLTKDPAICFANFLPIIS